MTPEPGGAAPGSTLLRALSAGSHLQGLEEHARAVAILAAAVQAQPADGPSTVGEAQLFADTLIALAECQIESDGLADSEDTLRRLDACLLRLADHGHSAVPALSARRGMCAARLAFWRRDIEGAITLSREAVQALSAVDDSTVHQALWRLRAEAILIANLSIAGFQDEAITLGRSALSRLDSPGQRDLSRDSVRLTLNVGNALWFQGDLDQAQRHYQRVIDIAQGQFDAGFEPRAHDLGRAHMNLGGVLVSANRLPEAVAAYRQALQVYSAQLRRTRRRREDVRRLEASQASTWMNLGYAHFRAREFDQAARWLGRARRHYARVEVALPHLLHDEARTWVNEGHVLLVRRRNAQAEHLYRAAIGIFEQGLAIGAEHLQHDLANARLGLAKTRAATGHPAEAAGLTRQALDSYAALVERGQLHHAQAWLEGLLGVIAALVTRASGSRRSEGVAEALANLGHCLLTAPMHGHPVGDEQLRRLDGAMAHLVSWCDSVTRVPGLEALLRHLLRHLLTWLAGLLGDADPAWMLSHAASLARSVGRLWQLSRKLPESALLQADWYLCTRGLRAQRDALALSTEPRIMAFAALQTQLWRIEQELLAATTLPGNGGDGLLRAAGITSSGSRPNSISHSGGDWLRLRQLCDGERAHLVLNGLLPQRVRASAAEAASRLPVAAALCLLARPQPDCLLVIVLQRLEGGALRAGSQELTLDSPLADAKCAQWLALVRRDLSEVAGRRSLRRGGEDSACGSDSVSIGRADFALAMLQSMADAVAGSLKCQLGQQPVSELVLAPSDDLHLVPWRCLLARAWPEHPPLRQFPSVAAWLRTNADAGQPGALLRWSVAIGPDAADSLPWVLVEAELSRRLWDAVGVAAVLLDAGKCSADGVDALIGMGHGGVLVQQPGVAGLSMSPSRVLTAHDLPNIRRARSVVLSSCVLAQTHEVLGEPLGFLSEAFGYGVDFGCGWLTEVPDDVACLFSLAFQYMLRQRRRPCQGGNAVKVSWLDSFDATCSALACGRWPDSFAAWLTAELSTLRLPQGVIPGDLTAAPPPTLRRMLPWVIALGS